MKLCTSLNQGHTLGGITERKLSIFQQCLAIYFSPQKKPKKNVRIVTVLGKEDLFSVTVRDFMVLFEPCKLESW